MDGEYITFQKGDYLIHQAKSQKNGHTDESKEPSEKNPAHACMILTGEAEIFSTDEIGKRTHIAYIGPHQLIGEMSLINGKPHQISAIATTETLCRVIDESAFSKCLEKENPFVTSLLKLVTSRYRNLLQDYAEEQ